MAPRQKLRMLLATSRACEWRQDTELQDVPQREFHRDQTMQVLAQTTPQLDNDLQRKEGGKQIRLGTTEGKRVEV